MAWTRLLWEYYGGITSDDLYFFVFLPWISVVGTYYVLCILMLPLDFWPPLRDAVRRRKCQPKFQFKWDDIRLILLQCTRQFLVLYPALLLTGLPLLKAHISTSDETLPSVIKFIGQVVVHTVCAEVIFYYAHRALHHESVYQYIHAEHHKYLAPCCVEALYFHWLEAISLAPVVTFGPLLVGSHIYAMCLWLCLAVLVVVLHHSGYDVPCDYLPGTGSLSHFHDYHHKTFTKNYGLLGWLDELHGTNKGWKDYLKKWHEDRAR
jgi:methylsterol monooxygenase